MKNGPFTQCIELNEAIRRNDIATVESLLDQRTVSLPRPYFIGDPLPLAVGVDSLPIFRLVLSAMLRYGCPDTVAGLERAACIAVLCGNMSFLRTVIAAASELDLHPNWNQATYNAITRDIVDALKILLDTGLEEERNGNYFSWMFAAREHKSIHAIEALRAAGKVDDPFSVLLMEDVGQIGRVFSAREDLEGFRWPEFSDQAIVVAGARPIHVALSRRLWSVVPAVAESGGFALAQDDVGLSGACMARIMGLENTENLRPTGSYLDIVDGLKSPESCIDCDRALLLAAMLQNRGAVTKLLRDGANPDVPYHADRPYTSLALACRGKDLKIARALSDCGARRELSDPVTSAVACALYNASEKFLLRLLDGYTIEHDTYYLHQACSLGAMARGMMSKVKQLLASGHSPDARDGTLWALSPLHHLVMAPPAVGFGGERMELVAVLLEAGAALDSVDGVYGATPAEWLRALAFPEAPESDFMRLLGG